MWKRGLGAIRAWQMFSMPWVNLHWQNAPIVVGSDIAVSIHHFGFYSLNACRIVYLVDEEGAVKRFGFAYGTLAEHAESGEERFTVEWNRADDTVSVTSDLVNGADLRVIERGGRPRLTAKTFQRLRVLGQIVREEFQGDEATEIGVLGFVDNTHPAAAQLLDDAVVRDGLADHYYVT
jgi:hypothetical protein